MNLASTDIVDKQGRFSEDGLRVLNGIQKAMAADPDITPQLIRTTLANAKTAGFSLDEDSIARMLINAGSRGVRAANETFKAIKAASGTVDVKTLNNSLADLGLLVNPKRNKKGNVIAGSGKPIDEGLLNQDPATWFQKHFVPKMKADLAKEGKDVDSNAERIAYINKKFAGMSSAGIQGITDMILGFDQMNAALAQARLAMEQPVSTAVEQSWVAQAENVATAWKDAAAAAGEAFAKSINLADILKGVADRIREDPNMAVAAGGFATVVAGALGVAVTKSLLSPVASLSTAGTELQASAGALTRAAAALGGESVLPEAGGGRSGGKGTTPGTPSKWGRAGGILKMGLGSPYTLVAAAGAAAAYLAYEFAPEGQPDEVGAWTDAALKSAKMDLEAAKRAQATAR
ncbi:hypothetical protein CWO89_34315, partial [Bradyrhizobium sp. Leo170]